MKFAYVILIPMAVIWFPFFLLQLITGAVCFCLGIKCVFSKLYIVAEHAVDRLERLLNSDKYLKFAMISSYILIGIMFLAKIFGVESD